MSQKFKLLRNDEFNDLTILTISLRCRPRLPLIPLFILNFINGKIYSIWAPHSSFYSSLVAFPLVWFFIGHYGYWLRAIRIPNMVFLLPFAHIHVWYCMEFLVLEFCCIIVISWAGSSVIFVLIAVELLTLWQLSLNMMLAMLKYMFLFQVLCLVVIAYAFV